MAIAIVVLAALVLAFGSRIVGDTGKQRVILYGDSLSYEARVPFTQRVEASGKAGVTLRVVGGTAICDWLGEMRKDAPSRPDLVMLEFVGNDITPCMKGADGQPLVGEALVQKYERDADTATRIFTSRGIPVVWVAGPIDANTQDPSAEFRDLYRQRVAPGHAGPPPVTGASVTFVDAGAAVLDHGRFTRTLPCLPGEGPAQGCRNGRIVVRAPDGQHFCPPQADVHGNCPVYSSGAVRFGRAMADAVVRQLGL